MSGHGYGSCLFSAKPRGRLSARLSNVSSNKSIFHDSFFWATSSETKQRCRSLLTQTGLAWACTLFPHAGDVSSERSWTFPWVWVDSSRTDSVRRPVLRSTDTSSWSPFLPLWPPYPPPSGYRTSCLIQPLLALFSQVTQWARVDLRAPPFPSRPKPLPVSCSFLFSKAFLLSRRRWAREPCLPPASTSRHLLCRSPLGLLTPLLGPLQPKPSSSVVSVGQPLGKSKKHQRSKNRQWVNCLGKSF